MTLIAPQRFGLMENLSLPRDPGAVEGYARTQNSLQHYHNHKLSHMTRALRVLTLFLFISIFSFHTPARAATTGSCAPITNGLVGWWKLDDGSSGTTPTTVADSSGSGNTGGTQGSPTWTSSGKIGNALTLNGTSQAVNVATSSTLEMSGSWTVSMWVKFAGYPSSGAEAPLFSKLDKNQHFNYLFVLDNGWWGTPGTISWMALIQDTGGGWNAAQYVSTPATGSWYFAAATYNSTTQALSVYINGALAATITNTHTPANVSPGKGLGIGGDTFNNNYYANATIDDARVYNRALSAAEIQQLYNNYNPGSMIYNAQWRGVQYCDGGNWVAMGSQQYNASGVNFDGSTIYLTKNANPTGLPADNGKITGSFWFQRTGNFGTAQTVMRANSTTTYNDAHSRYLVEFNASNQLHIRGADSSGTPTILVDATTAATFTDSNWHHVVYSFDLSNSSNRYIYVDGAADAATWGFYVNGNINLNIGTTPRWSIGANGGGTSKLSANLADFWFVDGTYIDLSQTANRALFYNSGPVYLGADGSTPTGATPQIFFSGNAAAWIASNNLGSGGVFTINGPLTDGGNTAGIGDYSSNLVGWWKLDDASSGTTPTTAADSSGNGNNGTNKNSPTWTGSGKIGNALILNGSNQRVEAPDVASLEIAGSWTASIWVKFSALPGSSNYAGLLTKAQTGGTECTNYGLYINNGSFLGSGIGWGVDFDYATNNVTVYYQTSISTGTWYHLAGVYDSSASKLYLYLNGILVGSTATAGHVPLSGSGNPLTIGDDSCYLGSYAAAATVDDARVYNRALSATDVWALYNNTACTNPAGNPGQMLYNADHSSMQYCDGKNWIAMGPANGAGGAGCSSPSGNPGAMLYNKDKHYIQYCDGTNWIIVGGPPKEPEGGLVGWWKLDDASSGTSTTAVDSSGNNNNGTTQNSPTWTSSGKVGNALTLNGTTQWVRVPDSATLRISSSWTVSSWVKLSALPGSNDYSAIVTKSDSDNATNYGLFVANSFSAWNTCNSGSVWAVAFQSDSQPEQLACVNGSISTGTWYFLTGVYDSVAKYEYLYLNGVLVSSLSTATVPASGPTGDDLAIGLDDCCISGLTAGTVDDVRIYNRALSASEVWDLYLATGGT